MGQQNKEKEMLKKSQYSFQKKYEKKKKRSSTAKVIFEDIIPIVALILIFVIAAPVRLAGTDDMNPFSAKSLISINRFSYLTREINYGDIVTMDDGKISRVVGLGKDKIAFHDGYLERNGKRVIEGYLSEDTMSNGDEIEVPAGKMLCIPDKRETVYVTDKYLVQQNDIGGRVMSTVFTMPGGITQEEKTKISDTCDIVGNKDTKIGIDEVLKGAIADELLKDFYGDKYVQPEDGMEYEVMTFTCFIPKTISIPVAVTDEKGDPIMNVDGSRCSVHTYLLGSKGYKDRVQYTVYYVVPSENKTPLYFRFGDTKMALVKERNIKQ